MRTTIILQMGILAILRFPWTSSENVVFLSLPMYSHLNPMVKTANELSDIGHTSYILIPESYRNIFNPIKHGVNFVIVEEFQEWLSLKEISLKVLVPENKISMGELFRARDKLCDRYLSNAKLFQTLQSLNISLAIVDGTLGSVCFSIFAYKLNVPFLLIGVHIQLYWHRTPWIPTLFPEKFLPFSDRMTFSQKLRNLYAITYDYIYPKGIPTRNIKEYAPERPDIDFRDLMKQCELFIFDSDIYLDFALPALPNVKYIGGLATIPAVPLHGEILEFVNSSKHGIIVVSPGSFVSWPAYHTNKMAEAFSQIKYDVVWKSANSSYSRQNVLFTKWLPQNDLLGHPNTKLFITHCGNSGQYETLYHAVPMIGFPVYADQYFNCNRMQIKGYGITMDTYNYTVDELIKKIDEVIENPKYKNNIAKMSHMFHSQKERPAEKAARHVDEIIKYGGSHLRSACQEIPLYEFLMLDILTIILSVAFIILYLSVFILDKCCRLVGKINKTKME